MKVIKTKSKESQIVTLRLPPDLVVKVDAIANKAGVSRGNLLHNIIRQTLSDPKFVLKIED
jgi:metal-responsive CopG/Arc/MetJ family transcriptional regulator